MNCFTTYSQAVGNNPIQQNYGRYNPVPDNLLPHPQVREYMKMVDGYQLPENLNSLFNQHVFISLVESTFMMLSEEKQAHLLMLFDADDRRIDGYPSASLTWKDEKFSSVIFMVAKILNRPLITAALVLGKMLGIVPEYCFQSFPGSGYIPPIAQRFKSYIPSSLAVNGYQYRRVSEVYIKTFTGTTEQTVCYYEYNDPRNYKDISHDARRRFTLVASMVETEKDKFSMLIGTTPAPGNFFLKDQLGLNPGMPVIIFLDEFVAGAIQDLHDKKNLIDTTQIIPSGCFGGAKLLEALDFKQLTGHPVVIVPHPSRKGFKDTDAWIKRCKAEGVTSVRIYPYPVLKKAQLEEITPEEEWEFKIWQNAQCIDELERPSMLLKNIHSEAMEVEDFTFWQQEHGLISTKSTKAVESSDQDNVNIQNFGAISPKAYNLSNLCLEDLFNPRYITQIWGPTDCGKSLVALDLSIALATGTMAFGIQADHQGNILYIDGEADSTERKAQVLQLIKNRPELEEILNNNLYFWPVSGSFSGLNNALVSNIKDVLLEKKINYLIIDNLVSLDFDASVYPKHLIEFIREMQGIDVAVIFLHHSTKKKDEHRGSSALADMAQNVFMLNRAEDYSYDTLTTEISIQKCKIPGLTGGSAIYRLPFGEPWQHVAGSLLPDSELSPQSTVPTPAQDALANIGQIAAEHDLSPDERSLYAAFLANYSLKRTDVEELFKCSESTAGDLLNSLVEKGLVIRKGQSRNIHYILAKSEA